MSTAETMHDQDQDRIDLEAAEWLAKRSAGFSPAELAQFGQWRERDIRHAHCFDAMARTWSDVASLSHLAGLAAAPVSPTSGPRPTLRFRPWHGVAALAACAALLSVGLLPSIRSFPVSHETRIAEIRPLTLPDGTRVTLGARSRLVVDFSLTERRVELVEGQAFFDIAPEAARPFRVIAGQAIIRDIGTKFDVIRSPGSLRVAVLEGSVEVREAGARSGSVLHAGHRFEATQRIVSARARYPNVQPVKDVAPGGWREGRLAYENDRLGDVVADLNRYHAPGLRIADDAADIRVTASFRTDEIPSFLQTLESVLPVKIAADTGNAFIVRAR